MDFSATTEAEPQPIARWTSAPSNSAGIVTGEAIAHGPEKLAILKARAQEIAKIPEQTEASTLQVEVTEFRSGEETYAFASTSVREVFSPKGITPLPCTPSFLLGIVNVRGRILPVIDIKSLFGLPSPPRQPLSKVIVIHAEGMEVGLCADTIVGVRAVSTLAIYPPLPTLAESQSRYIYGITNDGTIMLDATSLLTGSRLGSHR
jgi:purine-binding chemotaxis protein CheW